ncbi:MAG: CsbD family protein [Caldilineaceae bacterium]|nr:CsbD family protein [Myxococcales bacterium]MCB0092726.1 CsbD family protein [Caldilineaceae bacterium]MCB0099721.1 CsbD family protein [Caldilineaceae bacterium]MCB9147576.1 CsbD family protein [Caldilineaceae bacterium]MCB9158239.1 CsbD family protein [Caldilineaceae bacterium]
MNSDILEGKWQQLKGHVKEQWGELTDNEVAQTEGNYDQLVGLLQEKYGYARQRAEEEVNAWAKRYRN